MGPTFTERRARIDVLGWPTDVISIDPVPKNALDDIGARPLQVHTILFWIPGNPGQHDWYISDFMDVLSGLGEGYAVRSVSHAGHGLFGNADGNYGNNGIIDVKEYYQSRSDNTGNGSVSPLVPWTVEGQVLHKIAYIDSLVSSIETQNRQYQMYKNKSLQEKNEHTFESTKDLKFIMIGHSFGCHIIQRMCVQRPDILERVSGHLFLMPYIRTKPSFVVDQRKLDFAASHSELLIAVGTKLSRRIRSIPDSIFRSLIQHGLRDDGKSDETIVNITTKLLSNPSYPSNFFELGTEELRDIPNEIDVAALRLLSSCSQSSYQKSHDGEFLHGKPRGQRSNRPIYILYAGDNDQWCPYFHAEEIKGLQSANLLPRSIKTFKMSGLRHDYVCLNRSKRARVNDWMISNIEEIQNHVFVTIDNTSDTVVGRRHIDTDTEKAEMDGGRPNTCNPRTPTTAKLRSKL